MNKTIIIISSFLFLIAFSNAGENDLGNKLLKEVFNEEYAKSMKKMRDIMIKSGDLQSTWSNNFFPKPKLSKSQIEQKFGKPDATENGYHYFSYVGLKFENQKVIQAIVQYKDYSKYAGPSKKGLSFQYGKQTMEFFENGIKIGVLNWAEGKKGEVTGKIKNGTYTDWKQCGLAKITYMNGKGVLIQLHPNFKVSKESPFKGAVWHGIGKEYDDEGNLRMLTPVKNGVVVSFVSVSSGCCVAISPGNSCDVM